MLVEKECVNGMRKVLLCRRATEILRIQAFARQWLSDLVVGVRWMFGCSYAYVHFYSLLIFLFCLILLLCCLGIIFIILKKVKSGNGGGDKVGDAPNDKPPPSQQDLRGWWSSNDELHDLSPYRITTTRQRSSATATSSR